MVLALASLISHSAPIICQCKIAKKYLHEIQLKKPSASYIACARSSMSAYHCLFLASCPSELPRRAQLKFAKSSFCDGNCLL